MSESLRLEADLGTGLGEGSRYQDSVQGSVNKQVQSCSKLSVQRLKKRRYLSCGYEELVKHIAEIGCSNLKRSDDCLESGHLKTVLAS